MVPSRVLGEGAKGNARDLSGTGPPRPRPGMISGSLPSVAAFLASRACCLEERAGAAFFAGAFLALVSAFLTAVLAAMLRLLWKRPTPVKEADGMKASTEARARRTKMAVVSIVVQVGRVSPC